MKIVGGVEVENVGGESVNCEIEWVFGVVVFQSQLVVYGFFE